MASRRHARRLAERRALRRRLRQRCPACGKVCARNAEDAWSLAQAQWERFGGEPARRVYRCDGDRRWWHWTRKEAWVAV